MPGGDAAGVSASQVRSTAILCQIVGQSPTLAARSTSSFAALLHACAWRVPCLVKARFPERVLGRRYGDQSCLASSGTDVELLRRISSCSGCSSLCRSCRFADQVRASGEQLILGNQRLGDHANGIIDLRRESARRIARARLASGHGRHAPCSAAFIVACSARATGLSGYFSTNRAKRLVGLLLLPQLACSIALIDIRQARSGYLPSILSMWSRQAARWSPSSIRWTLSSSVTRSAQQNLTFLPVPPGHRGVGINWHGRSRFSQLGT